MSISVSKIVNLPQAALKFLVDDDVEDEPKQEYKTIGGVLSDSDYAWLANGPRLEVVQSKTGNKVGSWTFGWVLKDVNTEVVCVEEIQRPNARLPLLAVGLNCDFSGGIICIYDFITTKIVRAIHIKNKITSLHVIDAGYDIFTLPSPLRNFDGIIAVGTAGGDVFLVDICRQICDEALSGLSEIRDELNPCQLFNITSKDLVKIEHHKEFAVRNSHHLALHLNVVFDKATKHFTLKGPKGDDRIHVNKDEVAISGLYYCPQLGSLLVGYNFGALQVYNLMNLNLVYTSPVCDEHIPVSHFAIQEPADDPRAVCYVWAIYSPEEEYSSTLPLAVMYAFCYHSKEYHEGYGCLYQDFSSASVHYQMELCVPQGHKKNSKQRGGNCLKVKAINMGPPNKEGLHHDSNEDNLTLCMFLWNVWFNNKDTQTFLTVFDLNQWYKEQMPNVFNAQYSATYMLQIYLNDLINSATNKDAQILDVFINNNSIQQFAGAQRLEEHFYPNSITFGMTCLRETDVVFLNNYGVQKALLAQIESSGPLCLVEPAEIYQDVIGLGLVPLFIDLPGNTPISTNQQREIILGAALENHLVGWLCKCASEWANGSFLSTGCSLDLLISWAFQRAITLKTNCDKYCTSLFDYSEVRLDNNTNILLSSCTRQLKNLYSLYGFIVKKLLMFVSNPELVEEQYKSLETVSVYFEVLQWLLNVGLLPECPITAYPRSDDLERISAPYPAEMLMEFYNHRRALLKILNEEHFGSSDSVLFIDNLIEQECGGNLLQEQWRSDGGNGFYPPPSLQALLRTYLIDNVDLSFKHSVIIYVFLDLAMTLDQEKYKPVITHLIKFPAVFQVSPSVIKLTQAFWQLDHSDYNTAVGLLLDPLISPEDLSPWHHKIVIRALMLQKQHNFALLYVQVRKPLLKEDDDILTAISLLITNNMIDEAFYFEKHFVTEIRRNKFLTHIFNECKKNEKVKSLIYRNLSPTDESFFLKYLTNSNQPSSEDLHVYYHILRSHFMEAFEVHDRSVPNQIENQGLVGQENALPRDKLIHNLKKLLPDVSRNLLSLCHKERINAWQQVTRPTPLSVFVHNLNENVHYKSTIIGAALAKAKQTFNESFTQKCNLETERTPFLRTPTAVVTSRRSSAVVVNPRVLDVDAQMSDESCTPPSAKRRKLSPRLSIPASIPSKLETPLVKRKTPRVRECSEERRVTTPHSILKVKSFPQTPKKDGEFKDDFREFEKIEYTPVSSLSKKSGLGLSPRKSLAKSSPVVRFEGVKSTSSSSLNNSRSSVEKSPVNVSSGKLSLSSVVNTSTTRLSGSSKNTSTEEEVFYSPDTSLEDKDENQTAPTEIKEPISVPEKESASNLSESVVNENEQIAEEPSKSARIFSPRGRRSYKRSLGQLTPVRSSPRLARSSTPTKELEIPSIKSVPNRDSVVSIPDSTLAETSKKDSESVLDETENKSEESVDDAQKSSPVLPKLRPRKSLCRKVLETNALNRVLSSPLESPRRRSAKITPKVTTVEENTEKVVLESKTKYEDGDESYQTSLTKKHSLTKSIIESDAESTDYSIDYDVSGGLKLSDSIQSFLNSTRKSLDYNAVEKPNRRSEIGEETSFEDKEETDKIASEVGKERHDIESTIENSTKTNEDSGENETQHLEHLSPEDTYDLKVTESSDVQQLKDSEIIQDKSVFDVSSTVNKSKSIAYSILDSSTEMFSVSFEPSGPKLSDSMMDTINNREFEPDVTNTENTEDEVMEVDEDVEVIEEIKKDKKDELVYATLENSTINEESNRKLVFQNDSPSKQNREKEDESGNNRPLDPEMNVFEITDDLSFNDGLAVEKEVTLEENDLCYDQQNTLESVLEENITGVSSTPLNAFEKNVFNENYGPEEESGEEEEEKSHSDQSDEDEGHQDQKSHSGQSDEDEENQDQSNENDENKNDENDVIEIGSSSEEENRSKEESSSSSQSDNSENSYDEEQETSYERNIYDSDHYYLSESSNESRHTEISENSNDRDYKEMKEGCGLFQGDIVFVEEENISKVQGKVCDEDENKAKKIEDEDEKVEDDKKRNETDKNVCVSEEKEQKDEEKVSEVNEDVQNKQDIFSEETKEANKVEEQTANKFENIDENKIDDKVEKEDKKQADNGTEKEKLTVDATIADEDVSVEMDELNYSVSDEKTSGTEKPVAEDEQRKEISKQDTGKDSEVKQKSPIVEEQPLGQKIDSQIKSSKDPLNVAEKASTQKADAEDSTQTKKPRRSRSTSSTKSASKDRGQKSEETAEDTPSRRLTRRQSDILEKVVETPECEPDIIESLVETVKPIRLLRSRRVSTEEISNPVVTLRKRSASVDEVSSKQEIEKVTVEAPVQKGRSRRAASVVNLPKIPEEGSKTQKKAQSLLEGYSTNRRLTRRQMSLLKKVGESKEDLAVMDPIVLLDKVPFEGKPDPEEQKVYDTSPSTTNSTSSSPVKPSRRLRSASQSSEPSRRSKSKTPVRSVRTATRKKSMDENETTKPRKKLEEIIEDTEKEAAFEPRTTRSRAKSVSSVSSDDSNASEKVKLGKRRQRVASQSQLPDIEEEPEKSAIPKKRTRKNSSQI